MEVHIYFPDSSRHSNGPNCVSQYIWLARGFRLAPHNKGVMPKINNNQTENETSYPQKVYSLSKRKTCTPQGLGHEGESPLQNSSKELI